MSHDAFIRFDGIEARNSDADQPGWIRVWSFHHTIAQPAAGSAAAKGDAGPGRADHGDFSLLKAVDEASPRLALLCCAGSRIPNVVLAVHDSANFRIKYMEYHMRDVIIRAIAPFLPETGNTLSGGGARTLREEVALRYRTITWTFTSVANGAPQGDVRCYWDISANMGG